MGNTQPTSSKLKVHIQTQKQFQNSGSIIQGVVFVNAIDNFSYDALYIRVEGDQYCQWFEGSSKNRRKFTGNENFYAIEHILCRYQSSMLQSGKYAYPFSLQLSENIPGSFSSSKFDAKIDYKLIAYFANFTEKKHRSYHQIPLIIRQPFRQQQCQYQGTVTQNPTNCFCCGMGEVKLEAEFQKNVCFEGETVNIKVKCDNTNGKSNIKRIGVQLAQYTFVSANNGTNRTYKNVIKKFMTKTEIPKRSRSQDINIPFQVPPVHAQTAISTLVANYFRLQVFADLGQIVQNQPCIYSPLFVMKNNYNIKEKISDKKLQPFRKQGYKVQKAQLFKAPEYWFRKNKNLQVMNFRLEDGIQTQAMLRP